MKKPKYLYRPNDYSVFHRLKNGKYKLDIFLEKNWHCNEYDCETLINCGFIPCTEDDLGWLKEKHDFYYEYISWCSRPDGHGGSKGGTEEEYLEYLERVKRYNETKTKND